MTLQFVITAKSELEDIAVITGERRVPMGDLTAGELLVKIPETEAFLEKLTGLQFRIRSTAK